MPIDLGKSQQVVQRIYLRKIDEMYGIPDTEDPTYVDIKQASIGDTYYILGMIRDMKGDDPHYFNKVQNITVEKVFRTLTGTNIVFPDDAPKFIFTTKDDIPKIDMTFEDFKRAFYVLPDVVAAEIINSVFDVNPHWGLRIDSESAAVSDEEISELLGPELAEEIKEKN